MRLHDDITPRPLTTDESSLITFDASQGIVRILANAEDEAELDG